MRRALYPILFLLGALTAVQLAPILCVRVARERRELLAAAEIASDYLERNEPEMAARVLDAAIDATKRPRKRRD